MKVRVLLVIFSLFVSGVICAQTVNVQIKGQVVDSLTNETVSYATVRIAEKSDSTLLKAVAADDKGKFQLSVDKAGEYILSIDYTGKNTVNTDIVIDEQKVLDLGKILMTDNSQLLSEVVISAQRPLVQIDLDKIIYSMENDPEAKTNNVLDMLRKVPLVTVDGNEDVQLKGSTSFRIHLNGKPSNMLSKNPKEVLRSMPASSVKEIKVITDPGAKYDAEGVTGIIDIITHSNSSMGGYTANLNARVDDTGSFGGGVYLSMKYGKIGFTGNYNYSDWKSPKSATSMWQTNLLDDVNNAYLYHNGTYKGNNNWQNGSGELSYEIDTLNLINIGFNRYFGGGTTFSDIEAEMRMSDNVTPYYRYKQTGERRNPWGGNDLNVDYQRTFNKKDQLFTASYRLSLNPDYLESNRDITDVYGTLPGAIYTNKSFTDASRTEHTFQGDFVTPLGKIHNIEAGIKYILRLNESTSETNEKIGSEWVNIPNDFTDRFEHRQDILSAYGGYSAKFKKWGVKTGLRYEATWQDVKFPRKPDADFSNNYDNWVPSATVTYQIKPAQTIRLGYNMRISRPGIWELNPYEDTSTPNFVRVGNPELEPVESHSINTNYGYFSPKLNLNFSAYYYFSNNGREEVYTLKDEILYLTYKNIAKSKGAGISGYINWTPTDKIRLTTNMGGWYNDIRSTESEQSNQGFFGHMWIGGQYNFPKSWKLYLDISGNTPWVGGLQTKGLTSSFYHGISVSKGFLKDKLDVRAFADSPFRKNREWKSETRSEIFYIESASEFRMRRFGISASYRFGEMKEQIKKVSRSIHNDDSMGGGQGGQGQSGGGQN